MDVGSDRNTRAKVRFLMRPIRRTPTIRNVHVFEYRATGPTPLDPAANRSSLGCRT
jgi:hypothetical protein